MATQLAVRSRLEFKSDSAPAELLGWSEWRRPMCAKTSGTVTETIEKERTFSAVDGTPNLSRHRAVARVAAQILYVHVAEHQLQTRVAVLIRGVHGGKRLIELATYCMRLNDLPIPSTGILRQEPGQGFVRFLTITHVPVNDGKTRIPESVQALLLGPFQRFLVAPEPNQPVRSVRI